MSPEHLVVSERKEALKKQKDGGMAKGHSSQPERTPNDQSWDNWRNKIHNIVLDYSPKHEINI